MTCLVDHMLQTYALIFKKSFFDILHSTIHSFYHRYLLTKSYVHVFQWDIGLITIMCLFIWNWFVMWVSDLRTVNQSKMLFQFSFLTNSTQMYIYFLATLKIRRLLILICIQHWKLMKVLSPDYFSSLCCISNDVGINVFGVFCVLVSIF